jgi:hypothetical protein
MLLYIIILIILLALIKDLRGLIKDEMSFYFACSLCLWLPYSGLQQHYYYEFQRDQNICPIYSLKNQSDITGSFSSVFILGSSGSIDSAEKYYTFQKDDRGGFTRLVLGVNNCVLFEDENKQPYLSWQTVHSKPSEWIAPDWKMFYKIENTKYDIHIQKFKVD